MTLRYELEWFVSCVRSGVCGSLKWGQSTLVPMIGSPILGQIFCKFLPNTGQAPLGTPTAPNWPNAACWGRGGRQQRQNRPGGTFNNVSKKCQTINGAIARSQARYWIILEVLSLSCSYSAVFLLWCTFWGVCSRYLGLLCLNLR